MELYVERTGSGPPIVLVHGFTQTRRCWGPEADDLTSDHEVIRVDAPGHGRSASVHEGLQSGGRLIAATGGRATYLGYSMGARYCLHLALAQPELVAGLVMIGGTAGIEDADERAARRAQDLRTADRIAGEGVERFLDSWLAQPLFSRLRAGASFRSERWENTVEGLRSSLELAGTGSQEPSWDELGRLDMPVLVLAGALDEKFAALGERMTTAVGPNATLALVPDAGHAAHLEQPEEFLAVLRPWLTQHGL
jgi:2-succinyl-6-hydroxy-2,4-cyclohexadiene-1-carboxylate synthase